MHDVPGWVETLRGVILSIVLAVLALRIPSLRRPRQRPLWYVLLALATGSLAIQPQVGPWIDGATGIAKAGELTVTMVALTDFAAVWWLAVALHSAGHAAPARLRRAPVVSAAAMAVLAVAFFAVTPAPPTASGPRPTAGGSVTRWRGSPMARSRQRGRPRSSGGTASPCAARPCGRASWRSPSAPARNCPTW
ncbi:hypothetical protein GCM10020000_18900 [Streptomyces olivoverticillatus]